MLDEYGLEGYGRWFLLLEIVAEKMDETDRCHAEYSDLKWGTLLKQKQKKLKTFLKHCENFLGIFVEQNENIIKISVPNLLKKRDYATKKSRQRAKNVPPRSRSRSRSTITTALTTKDISKKETVKKTKDILDYLNTQASKQFQKTPTNLTPVRGRLEEFGEDACRRVIDNRVSHWKFDPKMNEYLRPSTVFCKSKFEGYLNSKDHGEIEAPRKKTTTEENLDVIKTWGDKQRSREEDDAGKLSEGDGLL